MPNHKQNFFIAVGVFAVAVVAVFWGISFAQNALLADVNKQYAANRVEMEELNKKSELLVDLRAEFAKVSEDSDKISAALLDNQDKVKFFEDLDTAAATTGNSYEIVSADEIINSSGKLQQINFQIKLSGSFSQLLEFLETMQNMDVLIDIPTASIKKIDEANIGTTINLTIFTK